MMGMLVMLVLEGVCELLKRGRVLVGVMLVVVMLMRISRKKRYGSKNEETKSKQEAFMFANRCAVECGSTQDGECH